MGDRARAGDLVQVERVVLPAGQRAPQVPEDTQGVPLVMRVKGYALEDGGPGDEIEIETVIGRRVRGRLVTVNPYYEHDFGRTIPELTRIGLEARAALRRLNRDGQGGGAS